MSAIAETRQPHTMTVSELKRVNEYEKITNRNKSEDCTKEKKRDRNCFARSRSFSERINEIRNRRRLEGFFFDCASVSPSQ